MLHTARYQDIADSLGISINTVRTHIRQIYRKLGVNKRGEAVARARALGLTAENELIPMSIDAEVLRSDTVTI